MGRILHVNSIAEWLTPELVSRQSFHQWCNMREVPFLRRKKQPHGCEYRCSSKRKHESFQDPSDFDFRTFSRLWMLRWSLYKWNTASNMRSVVFFFRASVNEDQILVTLCANQIKFICRHRSWFYLVGIRLNGKYNLRDLFLCVFARQ